jgi:hypothetical protein
MRHLLVVAMAAACAPTRLAPEPDVVDARSARPLGAEDFGQPIWGIHFYGDSPAVEDTISSGQPMWSVEMLYTTDWAGSDPQRERAKLQDIRDRGFRILLRLDHSRPFTVAPHGDWDARYDYASTAGQIAATVGDLVDAYIIGNEMTTQPAPEVRDALWYATVFNSADPNSVYDHIHANDPDARVMMGALSPWPWHIDHIGGDNVDWLSTVMDHVDQQDGVPLIDGYALHAYSGRDDADDPSTPVEDPRSGDVTGLRGFVPFVERIWERHGSAVPLHVSEGNAYWFGTHFADRDYRDDWIKEAYQAVHEWNRANDLKILSYSWYVYSHLGITDPGSDLWGNALMRGDSERLLRARADYAWVTSRADHRVPSPGSALHFEAENFSNHGEWSREQGVEGVDWHDVDPANHGGAYRNGTGGQPQPDIAYLPDWSGFVVGWMEPGEWLRYTTLSGGRVVRIRMRYARGNAGDSSVRLEVNGWNPGSVRLASTGSWDDYQIVDGPSFWLPEGNHELKLVAEGGGTNVDWFELIP